MNAVGPAPLLAGDLDTFFADLERGVALRPALEALLLRLPAERSDRLMLLLGEGRGAWHPWTRVAGGRALWLGNAFSGSWLALGLGGFEVTVVDVDAERLRFAAARAAARPELRARFEHAQNTPRLPFDDEAFDLVVQEEGVPGGDEARFPHDVDELLRVARGEVFVTAENRFAYKRSTGRRARFEVPTPWRWLARALAPPAGVASRRGHERRLARPGFEPARSRALYPHVRDFTHVVDLDGGRPRLPVGPLERKNRLKVLGDAVGLFPVLTPSFVTGVARAGRDVPATPRIERVLDALAARLGEPRPRIENWTATRGNCAVLLTTDTGAGGWALHVPMNAKEQRELERHDESLRELRTRAPEFPIPEPLFAGELEGLWLTCERRLDGIAATQVMHEPASAARMLDDAARHLASLALEPARPLSTEDLERLVGARCDVVAAKAHVPESVARVRAERARALEVLHGLPVPRVFYHADVRPKHVRVRPDGTVVGFLDLGCSSRDDLPYFDLVNLVVHSNKRPDERASTAAWGRLLARDGLRDRERAALERYAAALALPAEYVRTIEELYPILVVAMCERNWDVSRPRWLREHFGY